MKKDVREMINKILKLGRKPMQKYKSLGATSLMEAISMNGFSIKRTNDPEAQTVYFGIADDAIKEEVSFKFDQKGGIIVFSVNLNALKLSDNKLINWIQNKIQTLKNTVFKSTKISKVLKQHEDVYGVTIGGFVKGRYKNEEDGTLYDGRSLSIEIIGISTELLDKVAEDIAKELNQVEVLVKNYEENRIYLIK